MEKIYSFKFYNGQQLLTEEKEILSKMEEVAFSYDFLHEEDVLQYLENDSRICYMLHNNDLIGFSWLAISEELNIAELCWFVTHKQKAKGLDSKLLLDKTLEFCKQNDIKSLKFNCAEQSWFRIKDKNFLFKNFGYNVTENEQEYDVSIDI